MELEKRGNRGSEWPPSCSDVFLGAALGSGVVSKSVMTGSGPFHSVTPFTCHQLPEGQGGHPHPILQIGKWSAGEGGDSPKVRSLSVMAP